MYGVIYGVMWDQMMVWYKSNYIYVVYVNLVEEVDVVLYVKVVMVEVLGMQVLICGICGQWLLCLWVCWFRFEN